MPDAETRPLIGKELQPSYCMLFFLNVGLERRDSQLLFRHIGHLLRDSNLPFTRLHEIVGGSPQRGSECNQASGEKNDEKSIMIVDKTNYPIKSDKDRAMEIAATLGILSFYGLCAALGWRMAGRKR